MSRSNHFEQALSPTATMDSHNQGRHDSIQQPFKHNTKGRTVKPVSKRNAKSSAKKNGVTGSEEVSGEEENTGDEEDSSADQDDDEAAVEEPEVLAPSDVSDSAKHPATHLEAFQDTNIPTNGILHRTGPLNGTTTASTSKRRTLSETQKVSILDEKNEGDNGLLAAYPRQKTQRRLSNNHGFLTYDEAESTTMKAPESAIDLSDDDGYAAVDDISESEDEQMMEKLEEKAIVESELNGGRRRRRRTRESDEDSVWGNMDISMDLTTMGADSFFADQMALMPEDHTLLLFQRSSPSPGPSPTTRKVHFATDVIPHSVSSSETSSDSSELPDIFLDDAMNISALHSTPRGAEYDPFSSYSNSEDGSFWDWREEEANGYTMTPGGLRSLALDFGPIPGTEEESGSSSGYDSDESGDTTDDDMPPPPPVTTPRATLRSYKPSTRRTTVRHGGRPSRCIPILGTFVLDRSKAVAYRHKTIGVVVHPPKDRSHELARFFPGSEASTAQNSPLQAQFQSFNADDSDYSELSRNAFSGPVDVMFSGLFGGASNQTINFGGQLIGPPEAFYSFRPIDEDVSGFDLEDASYDEDVDDPEDKLNVNDFIDLSGSDADDEDMDVGMSYAETTGAESGAFSPTSPAPTDASSAITPFRANSIAGSEVMLTPAPSQSMLEHLDRGFVTSFRNNQDRARRLSRLPHDPAEFASTSRPVRSGYTADSVMTPLRKRKPSREEAANMGLRKTEQGKVFKTPRRPKPRLPARGYF